MRIQSINIREASVDDIPYISNYWMNANELYLKRMGVDLDKLPTKEKFAKILTHQFGLPYEQKNSLCLIWEVNEIPCGHSNTNPTIFGSYAKLHAHLWLKKYRNIGVGSQLMKKSIAYFFERLNLNFLVGEPYAYNPSPNIMLEKLGFRFVRRYITIPGSINFEQEVNRWELSRNEFFKT